MRPSRVDRSTRGWHALFTYQMTTTCFVSWRFYTVGPTLLRHMLIWDSVALFAERFSDGFARRNPLLAITTRSVHMAFQIKRKLTLWISGERTTTHDKVKYQRASSATRASTTKEGSRRSSGGGRPMSRNSPHSPTDYCDPARGVQRFVVYAGGKNATQSTTLTAPQAILQPIQHLPSLGWWMINQVAAQ